MRDDCLEKADIKRIDRYFNGTWFDKLKNGIQYHFEIFSDKEGKPIAIFAYPANTDIPNRSNYIYEFSGDCVKWCSVLRVITAKNISGRANLSMSFDLPLPY